MSESKLFEQINNWQIVYLRGESLDEGDKDDKQALSDLRAICAEYERRMAELERNNELMASRLVGHWVAPIEPDDGMLDAAMYCFRDLKNMKDIYKAMRDEYLRRGE